MKTRMDFVSNSSSCSFFIHLSTKESVDAFKELVPKLEKMEVLWPGYWPSLKSLSEWINNSYEYGDPFISSDKKKKWYNDLTPGCVVTIGTEEDDLHSMLKFDDALELVQSNPFKFQLYQDELAHQTAGKKIPKPRSIK